MKTRGIIVPLVTPLTGEDVLDATGLERLIEHVVGGGVHGLFLLGSTGEAPGLSARLRREAIERACRQVGGRVPVLVGITDTSVAESLRLAQIAHAAGAQALVLSAPYYFVISQDEMAAYVERLAPRLPLPLFLYNMPAFTKFHFEPRTVERLARIPSVAGVKDSSGDLLYFRELQQIAKGRPELSLLIGKEELLAEAVLLGADGAVCGGANLHPRLFVELYEAACAGNLPAVRKLHSRVLEFSRRIYGVGSYASSYLAGLKCALSLAGLCDDGMAEPLARLGESERASIREALGELGLKLTGRQA